MKRLVLICTLTLLPLTLTANPSSVKQTETKLKEINHKIAELQGNLSKVNNKRGLLNKELAVTEKKISHNMQELRSINQDIRNKEQKISQLEKHAAELNKNMVIQQNLLKEHIRSHYRIGRYQPLKWILNQDDPYAVNRIMTYHQYLIRRRQNVIDRVSDMKKNIEQDQKNIQVAITIKHSLERKLQDNKDSLEQHKLYHNKIIQSLDKEIQSTEKSISDQEKNKANLTRLLKTLTEQSQNITQVKVPFARMRRKLPRPVQVGPSNFKRMNQGLTFFAAEGTPVKAVHPGKIVFSDWLNGYGLLLIIDHGQGFMTLYAHNQALYKKKGSFVSQGEQIASVGRCCGLKENGLYFEVRQRGKAIPPMDWLSNA